MSDRKFKEWESTDTLSLELQLSLDDGENYELIEKQIQLIKNEYYFQKSISKLKADLHNEKNNTFAEKLKVTTANARIKDLDNLADMNANEIANRIIKSVKQKDLITEMMESLMEYRDELCNLEMHKKNCQYTYETKGCTCYVDADLNKINYLIQRAKDITDGE